MLKNHFFIKYAKQPVFFIVLILLVNTTIAQSKQSVFIDSTDNAVDISAWLLKKEGFLPIITLITEPALGYGVGGALVFFHSSFLERKGPPNMSGVFGLYTQNESWVMGGFHRGYWFSDRLRYTGVLARTYININFYGSGRIGDLDEPVELNMDSWLVFQQFYGRLKTSNFFLGGRYIYFPSNNTFDLPIDIPDFSGIAFEANVSEVSFLLNYDSRNNVFTPSKGIYAEVATTYSDTWMGGEDLYGRVGVTFLGFAPITSKLDLGTRLEQRYSIADVPFYLRPFINMRGVPVMKYQSNNTNQLELELNYNIYKRWHLLAFTGLGTAYQNIDSYTNGKSVTMFGLGYRYEIAKFFGADMGMDFAFSNSDFAFYIVFGHSWMK